MAQERFTLIFDGVQGRFKLGKIWFGSDGSYYLTCPYSGHKDALLTVTTVNYALQTQDAYISQAVDSASLEDEGKGLKLSHHPDGFLQFSGQGILSGLDEGGKPKGIGVKSWRLEAPAPGPSFGLTAWGFTGFRRSAGVAEGDVVFKEGRDVIPIPGWTSLAVEGYYFPPKWRRFVEADETGEKMLRISHPAGPILNLKIIEAPSTSDIPGMIGLECYADNGEFDGPEGPAVAISGSTGNLRQNETGEWLGDAIYMVSPPDSPSGIRSGNFTPPV